MINDEYKFVFIHINKTGGSSIEHIFGHTGIKHERVDQLKDKLGEKWYSYFKFTFVRNPWDRLVSVYFYRLKKGSVSIPFKDWLIEMRKNDSWSTGPQSKWFSGMDFVGRFEDLQNGFDYVCQRIGYQPTKLPIVNATSHEPYENYYDEETKQLVYDWHKEDIEQFGYFFKT